MQKINDFKGKAALITGGADGIGLALAEALSSAGARVFVSDIAAEKLKENAARIGAASAACDVTDESAVAELVERAWQEIGPIDLLCANAGVFAPGSILDAQQRDRDWIFAVNVWGILNACKPFARKLREAGRGGHILMTGSEHSLSSPQYLKSVPLHLYNMTKHCVLSMAESLRSELGPEGVAVSVLCPGPVATGLLKNSGDFRPQRFGGPTQVEIPGIEDLDEAEAKNLALLYMPASRAAEIALAGVKAGAFVIPTHPFEKQDVDARYREIAAGFDLLE